MRRAWRGRRGGHRRPLPFRRLLSAVSSFVGLALLAAACTTGGSSAEKAIISFQGQAQDFYNVAVDSVRHAADLRAAALKHLHDTDPNVRFASFYALTLTAAPGSSMAALQTFLSSSDVNERLPAAGAIVSRGAKDGLPVLIDALGSSDVVAWFDPPMEAWQYASFVLTTFTGQDFGLTKAKDAAAAARTRPAWQKWYREHGASLTWDPAERRFSG